MLFMTFSYNNNNNNNNNKQTDSDQRHWLMATTTIVWSCFLYAINTLSFGSARRYYYVSDKGIAQASLEVQLQLCPE